jgi:hypothetical protein
MTAEPEIYELMRRVWEAEKAIPHRVPAQPQRQKAAQK